MEPKNQTLEKEIPFGNHHFQVPCLTSGVYTNLFKRSPCGYQKPSLPACEVATSLVLFRAVLPGCLSPATRGAKSSWEKNRDGWVVIHGLLMAHSVKVADVFLLFVFFR